MANVYVDEEKVEVEDGSSIQEACESLGIPFSCKEGVCGSCLVNVSEGAENLGELNDEEIAFGLDGKDIRLACQCKITGGDVKVESAY
ncbi:MAG: 2Fe-2S iron-sulfur cluster binding domain-containing protein [Nanoarchaeota archaeon]|nr:2Fe-2S iron-sulfur cluster binding domain-containing protein [Nanoarchaeota archaeon]